jgi:hypothetical protein
MDMLMALRLLLLLVWGVVWAGWWTPAAAWGDIQR